MISGVNHITLSVKDIGQSFSFYYEILGLKPIQKSETSAYLTAGGLWIALVKDDELSERPLAEYTHLAFTISKDAFPKLRQKLIETQVTEWQKNWTEGNSFYFLDPNGHKLEIHSSDLETRIQDAKQSWAKNAEWFV